MVGVSSAAASHPILYAFVILLIYCVEQIVYEERERELTFLFFMHSTKTMSNNYPQWMRNLFVVDGAAVRPFLFQYYSTYL